MEEEIAASIRWHSSFASDAGKSKKIIGQEMYNQNIKQSEEQTLKEIMAIVEKYCGKATE